jgi:hypothetical protein
MRKTRRSPMRPLLIAALLAVGAALVGVVQVVNIPTAQGEVSVNIGVPVPYFFSPEPCRGCWHGEWNGRQGYHRGGGEPWRRDHRDGDHRGGEARGHGGWHGGHG